MQMNNVDTLTGELYMGVHLFLRRCEDASKDKIRAHYTISVINSNNDIMYSGTCSKDCGRDFKASTEGHGYKLLVPISVMNNPNSNVLQGDQKTLNILCKITTFSDIISITKCLPSSPSLSENVRKIYTYDDYLHGSLVNDLNETFKLKVGADVHIKMLNNEIMAVHSFMLKCRSKVFEAMFQHKTKERESKIIVITDFDSKVVKAMINFIYNDNVSHKHLVSFAYDLLIIADKYDLEKLKKICEQHLAFHAVNNNTFADLLLLSDSCNCPKLKEIVLKYLSQINVNTIDVDSMELAFGKRQKLFKDSFEALSSEST
ncbi:Protein roadkill-like protein [Leptotrombidium deliense]|uniref:Protein roadkill-like protein n=1 Tax=Leptotrombidium deliense TaxID=299467 RepID=A0A443SBW0_9ACAR|nr:Protein roadkill-like protein [Leptotrombidium deliense]